MTGSTLPSWFTADIESLLTEGPHGDDHLDALRRNYDAVIMGRVT
ncbi:MAG: hypothetical protein ACT4O0_05620 [Pseudonocardia sp.]